MALNLGIIFIYNVVGQQASLSTLSRDRHVHFFIFKCLCLSWVQIEAVGLHLQTIWPFIYDSYLSANISTPYPSLAAAVKGTHPKTPTSTAANITTLGGKTLKTPKHLYRKPQAWEISSPE